MYRIVESRLLEWKNNPEKSPLIIDGMRQCGKTYSVLEFGKKYFKRTVHVNFEKNGEFSKIFEKDLCPERIVHELSAYCRTKIDEDTLLFFDEIQLCGKALTSLKYFNEDAPEFNVICAGSLLGVKLAKGISFPVGKVDFLSMRPMNFKEFLIAEGEEQLVELLEELTVVDPIPPAFINRLENLYYDYLNVGGMPQVVKSWVENHNMTKVKNIQGAIIKGYESDFGKYTDVNEFTKITQIWESIPSQLAKDNKKFVFSHVKTGARSKDLEDALLWLTSAGFAVKVPLISKPGLPLSAYADETAFKLYLSDIGLLNYVLKITFGTGSQNNSDLDIYRGAIAENYVLCELLNIPDTDICYWRSSNTAEVEFVINHDGICVPIEVKANRNVRSRSLGVYIEKYSPKKAVRLSLKNMDLENGLYSIPLYMTWNLPKLLKN